MADIARLGIEIDSSGVPKADNRLKKLTTTSKTTETATKSLTKAWARFGKLLIAGGVALGIRAVVRATDAGQVAFKQLVAGLKSTQNASGQTISSLVALSNQMQSTTRFADDVVQSASAILLSFTNIADDAFPRTVRAAADVATRMGIDLRSAIVQLGKALNDPIANLGALSRSGIQFSKAQKIVIKDLVETNKLAEAQNIILVELERQYGGSATAARDTLGGAIKNLRNELSDFAEAMGKIFGRPLSALFNIVSGALRIFSKAVAAVVGESEKLLKIERELAGEQRERLKLQEKFLNQESESERFRREKLEDEKETAAVWKKINDARSKGLSIINSVQTAEEKLNETVAALVELHKEGAVSTAEFEETLKRLKAQVSGNVTPAVSDLRDAMKSASITLSRTWIDALFDAEKRSELTFAKIAEDFSKMVAKMLLEKAAMKLIERAFGAKQGAAFSGGSVLPLARGGVVTRPTLFPMAGGAGLMGEAGPEAVMPLTRTSSGDLGVKAETVSPVVNLNIINNTGEQVTESRRSSAQGVDIDVVIGESVKQHLNKGTFDRSMRSTFGLSRRGVQR
jgi:hypothetical protein